MRRVGSGWDALPTSRLSMGSVIILTHNILCGFFEINHMKALVGCLTHNNHSLEVESLLSIP